MNILTPVGCMDLLMPFHEAIIVYFWRAVSGSRGSGAAGGGSSLGPIAFDSFDFELPANFPNSHPISTV